MPPKGISKAVSKRCPECRKQLPVATRHCACGHQFFEERRRSATALTPPQDTGPEIEEITPIRIITNSGGSGDAITATVVQQPRVLAAATGSSGTLTGGGISAAGGLISGGNKYSNSHHLQQQRGQHSAMLATAAKSGGGGGVGGGGAVGGRGKRRSERVKREKPNFYDALEYDNQMRKARRERQKDEPQPHTSASGRVKRERRPKNSSPDEEEEEEPIVKEKKRRKKKKKIKKEEEEEDEDIMAGISPQRELSFAFVLSDINLKLGLNNPRFG